MMRRGLAVTATAIAGLLLIAGCAAPEQPSAAPEPPPAPEVEQPPAGPVVDIPIASGAIEDQRQRPPAPLSLSMPSLGIEMEVTGVGVDDRNYMEIPLSIYTAGWYRHGPGPASDAGATVIAAHVDMPNQGIGPFAALRDAEVGAEISVVDEAGVTHNYIVSIVERIEKAEVQLDQVFTKAGDPTLVLITCGGDFDFTAQSYTDNYIVTAEKVS